MLYLRFTKILLWNDKGIFGKFQTEEKKCKREAEVSAMHL